MAQTSQKYIYNNTFIFQEYETGLKLGGEYEDYDHNGVLNSSDDSLVEAIIPAYVNDKKVICIGYKALRNLTNLETAFIPRTVKTMFGDTFVYCYKLTTVIFEENSELEKITLYTFYCTGIHTITFPSTVKTIGSRCFYNCTNLKSIIIPGYLECNESDAFEGVTQEVKIYVPTDYMWDTFGGKPVIKILPPPNGKTLCQTCKYRFNAVKTICFSIFIYIMI